MKIFISWSRTYSHSIATSLHDWLPFVVQGAKPFVSSRDIHAGARWQADVAAELESSNFGLICVTSDNQGEPWLNFESGALSKAVAVSRVIPIAVDLKPTEIVLPLAQFMAQPLTLEGMLEVVKSINSFMPEPITSDIVARSVERWWPDLEAKVQEANQKRELEDTEGSDMHVENRSVDDKLDEILSTVRSIVQPAQYASSMVMGPGGGGVSFGRLANQTFTPIEIMDYVSKILSPYEVISIVPNTITRQGRNVKRVTIATKKPVRPEDADPFRRFLADAGWEPDFIVEALPE